MALFSDLYNVGVPTTSADLAIRVSDETGTGNLVFNTNPAFGGSILHNGVEHFTQSSPPSQRSDGSPLVVGDRWHKPDYGLIRWNGTYWVGQKRVHGPFNPTNLGSSGQQFLMPIDNPNDTDGFPYTKITKFLVSAWASGQPTGVHNANNYFTFNLTVSANSGLYVSQNFNTLTGNVTYGLVNYWRNGTYNHYFNWYQFPGEVPVLAVLNCTKVGTPSTLNYYAAYFSIQDVF